MLGRKTYSADEVAYARQFLARETAAYKALAVDSALAEFEPLHFNSLVLVLDRLFVHRVRPVSGKDTNPLTEVELLVESLLAGDVFQTNKVIKYVKENAVLGLEPGDQIRLTAADFDRLTTAFLAEIELRFGE